MARHYRPTHVQRMREGAAVRAAARLGETVPVRSIRLHGERKVTA